MTVAHTILKVPSDLRAIVESVGAIASHLRFCVLANVPISKLEVGDDFAVKVAFLELSLEHAIHVLQGACSMQLAVLKLAFVVEARLGSPLVAAFTAELAVLELAVVGVSVVDLETAQAMEYVRQELSLIDILLAVSRQPSHLTLSLHLRVHKVANVVPAVWPLELAIALNLGVFQAAPVNIHLFGFDLFERIMSGLLVANILPFLVSFAIDHVLSVEVARDFNGSIVRLFGAIALHLVLAPVSIVFRVI